MVKSRFVKQSILTMGSSQSSTKEPARNNVAQLSAVQPGIPVKQSSAAVPVSVGKKSNEHSNQTLYQYWGPKGVYISSGQFRTYSPSQDASLSKK